MTLEEYDEYLHGRSDFIKATKKDSSNERKVSVTSWFSVVLRSMYWGTSTRRLCKYIAKEKPAKNRESLLCFDTDGQHNLILYATQGAMEKKRSKKKKLMLKKNLFAGSWFIFYEIYSVHKYKLLLLSTLLPGFLWLF